MLLILIGVAMLFWSYTFLLGLLLIVFAAMAIFIRRLFKSAVKFTESKKLRYMYRTTYSVSDHGLRAKSQNLDSRIGWYFVSNYEVVDDWLIVVDHDDQLYFFPVSALKNRKVFDKVESLLKQHTTHQSHVSGAR